MRYIALLYGEPDAGPAPGTREFMQMLGEFEYTTAAVGAVARVAGDLSLAEDCAQEACVAALEQWPRDGLPANPGGWVVAVARHRALDHLRRESARAGKERQAAREWTAAELDGSAVAGDD